ncbi:MAG: hypothetical protein GY846_09490 [Deltaproteobacteria bacterium]|nr:hypothetical protein [Deltaproteobacteria bacterium]
MGIHLADYHLEAAREIAEQGSMGIHLADYHLEAARIYLARDQQAEAVENLAIAERMVGEMGYHRRDKEIEELKSRPGMSLFVKSRSTTENTDGHGKG